MNTEKRLTNSERSRITAFDRLAAHPFFDECYNSNETLIDAMTAKLDALKKSADYNVPIDPADETQCEACQ